MIIDNTLRDSAILSLHIISAAGFGVDQLWPGEGEARLSTRLPGFNTIDPPSGHKMTFKASLNALLQNLLFFFGGLSPESLSKQISVLHISEAGCADQF